MTDTQWDDKTVDRIAEAIHNEGGCCEWGWAGCGDKQYARTAAVVALHVWFIAPHPEDIHIPVSRALWGIKAPLADLHHAHTRIDANSAEFITRTLLAAVPDGWAKIDGEWVRITSDGVGYGEFDRITEETP